MRKRIIVPASACPLVEQLEEVIFEGWQLVKSRPLGRGHLLVYEADEKPDLEVLRLTAQQRVEPREGEVYVLLEPASYRAMQGGSTAVMPAQELETGANIRVRQRLPTGVWIFELVQPGKLRVRFTVSRREWRALRHKLRMRSDQEHLLVAREEEPEFRASPAKGGSSGSPLATAGSYLRVTGKAPTLPTPKPFDTFFSAPLPKRKPRPADDEEGGGNPFGRRR